MEGLGERTIVISKAGEQNGSSTRTHESHDFPSIKTVLQPLTTSSRSTSRKPHRAEFLAERGAEVPAEPLARVRSGEVLHERVEHLQRLTLEKHTLSRKTSEKMET